MEDKIIKVSKGKVFGRISDSLSKKIHLGYTHYLSEKKLEEPLLELSERFEEMDELIREVNR